MQGIVAKGIHLVYIKPRNGKKCLEALGRSNTRTYIVLTI